MQRRFSKKIQVGKLFIGGDAPVSVQSMIKKATTDIERVLEEARRLKAAGCDIIRIAVPDKEAALALGAIRKGVDIPLVADIHFDHRLALMALDAGVDKIRINPGNIGKEEHIREVLRACSGRKVPIRIGVNAGSLERHILEKYGHPTADAMVESAMYHIRLCEKYDFDDIIISLKASDVPMMIDAYRKIATMVPYPLHLGVTEAGNGMEGLIKSTAGIATLLADGIGDTIRVSLTDDPVEEVKAGIEILKTFHLLEKGVKIVSCPTCGRLEVDLIPIVNRVKKKLESVQTPITVALMGCVVNGPGEAREADIGVACGKGRAVLYIKGEKIASIAEEEIEEKILDFITKMDTNQTEGATFHV